jgi:hypothetical protein
MSSICLIACASSKVPVAAPARELYSSALFRKSRALAESRFDKWFILSAKHGLVFPDQILEPYNQTLNGMPPDERQQWACRTFDQLTQYTHPDDTLTFIAGANYREDLGNLLRHRGNDVFAPTAGMSIGRLLQWLDRVNLAGQRLRDLDRLYALMARLRKSLLGGRQLSASTGALGWPERGVYFFFEPGELRATRATERRIVRVGTHTVSKGSHTTLWNRLRTHRGGSDGSGSHRSSVFRLHVGSAILHRDRLVDQYSSWGKGANAEKSIRLREQPIEQQVSAFIGRMHVIWLPVGDASGPDSDRAFLEMNCVGLIAGGSGPLDPPGAGWLGRASPHSAIRQSGLWNVNYVSGGYASEFLDVFEQYVDISEGRRATTTRRLAPRRWHEMLRRKAPATQQPLF